MNSSQRASDELRQSEELYRQLIESSLESIIVHRDGIIIFANSTAVALHGAGSVRDLIGRDMFELVHPDFHAESLARRKSIAETGIGGPMTEMRFLKLDGTVVEVELQSSRVLYDGLPAIQITARDITRRRATEASLLQSEERYRRLFEIETNAIVLVDSDTGRIMDANPAAEKLYGYSREEFLSLASTDMSAEPALTRAAIARHEGQVPLRWHRKKDGTRMPVSISGNFFISGGCNVHVASIRDLTGQMQAEASLRLAEAQLRQSQKLKAIGTLASGIAHDFNNILCGIYAYTSLARAAAAGQAELCDYLDEINRAGHRAAELVRQILVFGRSDEGEEPREPVQLDQVVEEAAKLLRASSPGTITLQTSLEPNLPPVLGNSTKLHQVVMNLGTNAMQAMADRPGCLRLALDFRMVDEALAQTLAGLKAGPYVRLVVSDTGHGMDAATQGRVFEPFFTTKAPGQGTGLGLSVVHGIVNRHQGAIRLSSELGCGTTFELFLPAGPVTPVMLSATPPVYSRGNGERILVVDDDEPIARSTALVLRDLGYAAESESSVLAALARLERDPQAFQLVVTDQSMPELTGLDFAGRLHRLRSDLAVLLSTGYSVKLDPERIQAAGIREVLDKPYTFDVLAAAIRRHLPT